jgi:hypothetical protein
MSINAVVLCVPDVECHVDENGMYQGEYKKFYKDCTLFIHCFYVDDKRHGEYRDYRGDGSLWEIRNYRHGVQHGEQYWYGLNGDSTATMYYNDVDLRIDPRGLSDRDKVYVMMSGRRPVSG